MKGQKGQMAKKENKIPGLKTGFDSAGQICKL